MILITGNAGFIGRYLTSALIEKEYSIRGLDIRPRTDILKNFVQVEGNILDKDVVRKVTSGVDCIVHLAAEHKDFGITQDQYYKVNVEGTHVLLDIAAEQDIKKFIFYSSVAVYGTHQPSSDETVPSPNNHYGISKWEAEKLIHAWAQENNDRKVSIIRPAVVFGPHNQANIFRLVKQVCDRRFYWIGDGLNIKSIAYVENLVQATIFLLSLMKPGVSTYNYSDEPQRTTRELVELIAKKASVKMPTLKIPTWAAIGCASIFDIIGYLTHKDIPITTARIRKFNTSTCHRAQLIFSLGFRPPYTMEEGISKFVNWYLEQRDHSIVNSVEN